MRRNNNLPDNVQKSGLLDKHSRKGSPPRPLHDKRLNKPRIDKGRTAAIGGVSVVQVVLWVMPGGRELFAAARPACAWVTR